ncbi:hypothetical protein [Trichocoleus sp. DQ-U1]|uniref:hypothetical protein n=1 Tax=Trichocoleus sp. DQ-U1 TaxID=2933926 RepID=UPI003298F0CD
MKPSNANAGKALMDFKNSYHTITNRHPDIHLKRSHDRASYHFLYYTGTLSDYSHVLSG